jgi:hypothetical protein
MAFLTFFGRLAKILDLECHSTLISSDLEKDSIHPRHKDQSSP